MAISSIAVSSTDTVNTVTVTDSSGISVVTVGTQGLAGPNTILGRSVASVTAGSSDSGTLLVYDHGNTNWTTTDRYSSTISVGGLTVASGGVTSTPTLRVATVQYTDGDAAFIIADGGGVNIPTLTVTTLTTAGKVTLDNNEIEGGNFDINGGDIASSVTINKSPTITLAGDLSGSATLTALGNATLTATVTADATALGTDTTGAYVATVVAGEGIDISGSGAETANVTVSAEDATDANKGVASFNATDFSVSSGAVTLQAERIQDLVGAMFSSNTETGIAITYQDGDGTIDAVIGSGVITNAMLAGSISNANLANSTITVSDGSNTTAVALGGTITYTAGEGLDIAESSGTVTFSAEDATSSNKGVASFNATDFSVSSGAVTIQAERISDLVGAMVSSNTESGIVVTYQDGDNTLDFDVGDFDIALTGDVTGSGTVTNLGNVSIALTVAADSVALGTDTTGNYVGTITGGTGVDSTAATSGEGTTHTLSLDLNELTTETTIADADFVVMVDATDDGSGKITFENLEDAIFASVSGDITIAENGAATIANNAVALGTDTTGNYMIDVAVGEGLDVSHSQGEGSTATISAELATETNAGVATFDGTDFTVSSGDVTVKVERVQDIVGAMVSSNTESGIAVTYQDGDGTLDFDVSDPTITIDGDVDGSATMTNLGNTTITTTLDTVNSNVGSFGTATAIPAVTVNAKGLVTAISTNAISTSFTLAADSGSNDTFNTGETLTISGTSNEVETAVSNNAITIGLPNNVTIGGNLIVTGDYTVNGDTTTVSTATLSVEDPLIKLAKGNNAADSVDIGIYGLYDTSGSQDLYAGLFRDASDSGKWKLFKSLQPEPTTTVNVSGTGYAADTLVANLEGAVTGNASTATALATGRTIALSGDVVASGVSFDGSGNISLSTTIQANSVALGTDTTGNYIATIADAGNSHITVANSGAESAAVTLNITNSAVDTNQIADNAVSLAKMAGLARGKFIYGDSSGNPAALAVGSNGQVLKSDGTDISWGTDTGLTTEEVQDIAGGMFSSNTETGITVTYQDGDGTIDLVIGTLNQDTTGSAATLTTARTIGGTSFDGSANIAVALAATATALANARTIHGVSFDGTANIDLSEVVADTVGAMFSSNTETGITVTYQDGDNTIDLVVDTSALTETLTNKTLTSPVINTGVSGSAIKDEDDLSSDSATHLATQQSIKAYVDANTASTEGIQDVVGAMFTSNTESGISITYQDGDGTIDADVDDFSITLTGDVTGSGTVTNLANVSFAATIQANSVALGTDTTGNYVDNVTGGTGVSVTGSAGEGWEPAIAIGQAVGTSDSVTFGALVVDNFTLNGTELDLSSGDFTLDVAGDIILDADGGDIFLHDGGTQFGKLSKATNNITQFNTVDAFIVPAGTTGQRPTGAAGMFRYNSTLTKFEGYTSAWGEIGGGGSGLFSTNKFTGDGSETDFTLSTAPADEDDVMAFIDGVYQNKDSFTLSGKVITFDTAPVSSKTVIVHVVGSTVSGANVNLDTFTGNGSTTAFTLALDPATENNTQVYVNGVYQAKSAYSVSGTTLTFGSAPANSAAIEVTTFTNNLLNTISDSTVTSAKLSGALVTPSTLDVNGNELILDADADTSLTADTDDRIDIKVGGTDQLQLTDGAILPVTTNDIDLGSSSKQFKDAYIDGTLEADAITIAGVTLSETIADTVGAMVSSNTESGITVAYDDGDNTLDFTVGTLNQNTTGSAATLTTARTIGGVSFDGSANIAVTLAATATALASARTIGGTSFDGTANIAVALAATATSLASARTIHGVSFDGTGNIDLSEVVADTVGAMFSSNTETGITATYQDGDNTIDLVVGTLNQNTTGTAATVTGAAQSSITSLGTLTALTVDNLGVNGNTITANSGALNLTPASGSAIVLDGTINVDAGVVTGATSITSTAFVGALTGNVTGNASGTALTVTQAAQTAITSVGTLTGLTVTGAATASTSAKITQVAITSSSSAVAWDAAAAANAYHLTTENTTFSAPSNAVEGAIISVELAQGGTARTIAWNTIFEFAASTAPTVTATASKTDIFSFRYNGSVWQEIGRVQNMAQT